MTKLAESDWREGFLFVGNHLCLDFINTRPELNGKPEELLTDWSSLIRWSRTAELIDSREGASFECRWAQSNEAHKTVKAICQFREKVRRDLLGWERGARVPSQTLQQLNHLMSRHPMLTKIRSERGKLDTVQWFELQKPSDLFAPLAYAAANLFSELNPARVRKCEHCVLHFHDTSKIGTRRWCSMRLCGNRAKVAAYAARHSAGST
jgi:predicted RNA-binding Zn ribbon-like protein